jgi:predicted small lipoprotein YifL
LPTVILIVNSLPQALIPQALRRGLALSAVLACAFVQAGCGQTGPLYLPKSPPPGPSVQSSQSVQPTPTDKPAPPPVATPPVPVSPPISAPMPAIPASE